MWRITLLMAVLFLIAARLLDRRKIEHGGNGCYFGQALAETHHD